MEELTKELKEVLEKRLKALKEKQCIERKELEVIEKDNYAERPTLKERELEEKYVKLEMEESKKIRELFNWHKEQDLKIQINSRLALIGLSDYYLHSKEDDNLIFKLKKD